MILATSRVDIVVLRNLGYGLFATSFDVCCRDSV